MISPEKAEARQGNVLAVAIKKFVLEKLSSTLNP